MTYLETLSRIIRLEGCNGKFEMIMQRVFDQAGKPIEQMTISEVSALIAQAEREFNGSEEK